MPKGSDESWARKLYEQHQNQQPSGHFRKPRMSNSAFIILHFADSVQYECEGFLDKNRDTVFEEPINILRASQSDLVADLFQQAPAGDKSSLANGSVRSGKRGHREHKLTVGFQFRQSLQLLMDTLNSTTPHYVRCIKPNDVKEPFVFDSRRAVQQLRACGVLETIRISAAGYPSRWTYEEFFSRYRVLLPQQRPQSQPLEACQRALPSLIPDLDQYCFGKTKVFFRAGQVALLERLRAERLRGAGMVIQSWVRGWLARRRYTRIRQAALTLQRYTRGALGRRQALILRYTRAALVIQKTFRMLAMRQLYLLIRQATLTIQAFTRGTLARREYRRVLRERAAVRLQAWARGWRARRAYSRLRAAVVLTQSCARRRAARRELLRRKAEARTVETIQQLNKGMEVKLMSLQLRADQEARDSAALRETLHAERESHRAEVASLRGALARLEAQRQEQPAPSPGPSPQQEEERRRLQERSAQELLTLTQEVQALKTEREELVREKEDLQRQLEGQQRSQEECVRQAVSQASVSLRGEVEEERRKYQGLLREFTRLEQRYDNLRDMSLPSERSKGHRRTDSCQSLSMEPLSPVSTPFTGSPTFSRTSAPFPGALTFSPASPEGSRRVSVTSQDSSSWNKDTPMNTLMEKMGVAKDTAVKMRADDLGHAYDAVRVANKLLETQLRSQSEQQGAELKLSGREASANGQELLEAREQECVRLRRELQELRKTVTLRTLLTHTAPPAAVPCPSVPQARGGAVSGLLECRKRDEAKLMRILITELRADSALSLPPGLAARVLFLCVRQADHAGDAPRAHALCSAAITAMKGALKKHSNDVDMTALWLKNACLLSDLLTQHCPRQDGQTGSIDLVPLTSDLSDLRRSLGDLCIQAYQQLLSITETRLQPIIVPAMLESETIPGLSGLKPGGPRKRAGSDPRAVAGGADAPSMAAVLRVLSGLHAALSRQDLPPPILEQAFHQLTHLLCASTLNSLLLRKDMCCWNRGLQIRYNVSLLEEWLRSRALQTGGAVATLEPLIQAAQLLQVGKKTEADAHALVQTCTALSSQQIVKILTLYTPHSELEERVTLNFIRSVQALLRGRSEGQPPHLLLDVKRVFPVTFPFLPHPVLHADRLGIPESLKISFLRQV